MINTKILQISADEILDSRGNPTVSATVRLECGAEGEASVPSGASTGEFEAHEKRDGDKNRYHGKGTIEACAGIIKEIAPELVGLNAADQRNIDMKMIKLDGTDNKSNLGANAILAVSLAVARAAASAYGIPLFRYIGGVFGRTIPCPMMNILNGGAHADNNVDIQEFMIVPVGAKNFAHAMQIGCEIYHELKKLLSGSGYSTGIGDEGGFAPNLSDDEQAIDYLIRAIGKAGYDTENVKIALDVASSEWVKDGSYVLPSKNLKYSSDDLIHQFKTWHSKYPILSIEDPLGENDNEGWQKITEELGRNILLVGDDLFVTNTSKLSYGISHKMANAILIKLNQIGTLSETLDTVRMAKNNGYKVIISHRSGETCDSFIADLAVAVCANFIKAGAPARGERLSKYNRLIYIERSLNQ